MKLMSAHFSGSILSACHMNDKKYDSCMKKALNDIRPYFKQGKKNRTFFTQNNARKAIF